MLKTFNSKNQEIHASVSQELYMNTLAKQSISAVNRIAEYHLKHMSDKELFDAVTENGVNPEDYFNDDFCCMFVDSKIMLVRRVR